MAEKPAVLVADEHNTPSTEDGEDWHAESAAQQTIEPAAVTQVDEPKTGKLDISVFDCNGPDSLPHDHPSDKMEGPRLDVDKLDVDNLEIEKSEAEKVDDQLQSRPTGELVGSSSQASGEASHGRSSSSAGGILMGSQRLCPLTVFTYRLLRPYYVMEYPLWSGETMPMCACRYHCTCQQEVPEVMEHLIRSLVDYMVSEEDVRKMLLGSPFLLSDHAAPVLLNAHRLLLARYLKFNGCDVELTAQLLVDTCRWLATEAYYSLSFNYMTGLLAKGCVYLAGYALDKTPVMYVDVRLCSSCFTVSAGSSSFVAGADWSSAHSNSGVSSLASSGSNIPSDPGRGLRLVFAYWMFFYFEYLWTPSFQDKTITVILNCRGAESASIDWVLENMSTVLIYMAVQPHRIVLFDSPPHSLTVLAPREKPGNANAISCAPSVLQNIGRLQNSIAMFVDPQQCETGYGGVQPAVRSFYKPSIFRTEAEARSSKMLEAVAGVLCRGEPVPCPVATLSAGLPDVGAGVGADVVAAVAALQRDKGLYLDLNRAASVCELASPQASPESVLVAWMSRVMEHDLMNSIDSKALSVPLIQSRSIYICGQDRCGNINLCVRLKTLLSTRGADEDRRSTQVTLDQIKEYLSALVVWSYRFAISEPDQVGAKARINLLIDVADVSIMSLAPKLYPLLAHLQSLWSGCIHQVYVFNSSFPQRRSLDAMKAALKKPFRSKITYVTGDIRHLISVNARERAFGGRWNGSNKIDIQLVPIAFFPRPSH